MKPQRAQQSTVLDTFRRWGYLEADLDPLGSLPPVKHPELPVDGDEAKAARAQYCGSIGAEFMHIPDPERREWVQAQMEAKPAAVDRRFIAERLMRGEMFEQALQTRYLGTKRFSLEGLISLVPLLDEMLETIAAQGGQEAIMGMSHRGRLNVLAHIIGRPMSDIFSEFEDNDPRSIMGGGDVKYHLGATGEYQTRKNGTVGVRLVSNPSHLEAVDPVVLGRVRAKHTRLRLDGKDGEKHTVAIVMHGDAAFAGQGIWAETLNFSGVNGFNIGGSIHIINNNLIGFTTNPEEAHTSRFASDIAKRLPIPIFHVNAEDPDAVARSARMAVEYRYKFKSDVVVDLIGYRRYGHSEVDDPSITQPLLYKKVKDFPTTWERYVEKFDIKINGLVEQINAEYDESQKRAREEKKIPKLYTLPRYWDEYFGGVYKAEYEVETGVPAAELADVTRVLTTAPKGFNVHNKIQKLLEDREKMGTGQKPVDYGMAEALAFGTLLKAGIPIRMSGQDSRRGTFNHRHSVLIDVENENEYVPLEHVAKDQAWLEIYNSVLSEAAVMGFEYGFSRDYPQALVLWEAQFGDFANGAQIIIDQFVSAAEDKWGLLSGLVLLLPHGFEGQGPEHSSARIERYLQLAGDDNMQICQPSTAAQYFHLLRRQALRKWRKPLVVFTPKSMLRHPDASSPIADFERSNFLNVIPDSEVQDAKRILVCTGKIVHELRRERKKRKDTTTAIVTLEQMYPFPQKELAAAIEQHPNAKEVIWVQEEPANMGALFFVQPRLQRIASPIPMRSVKRSASGSPATGSHKAHEMEQHTLITMAFAGV